MVDELVMLLNGLGYQAAFLPAAGLVPPEVWDLEQGKLRRWGPLKDFLPASVSLPANRTGGGPQIEHHLKTNKNLKGAVGFLKNALSCLGLSSFPKLDLSFAGGQELFFSITGVTSLLTDPSSLRPCLKKLDFQGISHSHQISGTLHIAYEYLYATTLLLRRQDQQTFATDVSGKVGDYVDLGAKAKVSVERNTTIKVEAVGTDKPVPFAYKAGRLMLEKQGWTFHPEITAGQDFLTAVGGPQAPYLPAQGTALLLADYQKVFGEG
jgi:hypothetical protein